MMAVWPKAKEMKNIMTSMVKKLRNLVIMMMKPQRCKRLYYTCQIQKGTEATKRLTGDDKKKS